MKRMLAIRGVLALSPELWVGALPDYSPSFNKAFKDMVEVSAYDPVTHARWFPISYLQYVKNLIREHKAAPDTKLDEADLAIRAEIERRRFIAVNTDPDGKLDPRLVEAFATLGLHPSAPRTLVEWAIIMWRREGASMAVPQTQVLKCEEAYRLICGGL